jgi:hypothetical protein
VKTLLILFLSVIVFFSCSTVDEDCLCTEEYRFFLVTVVDTLGVPIDSLTVTIRDKDGDELNVVQDPHPFGAGKYTVLNDSFTQMLCYCPTAEKIYFSATDGNRVAVGEYLFNTDKCRCHINKVSGPDTLVIR